MTQAADGVLPDVALERRSGESALMVGMTAMLWLLIAVKILRM